jgi:imidazolonepropionase-like amidohydrolase
MRGCQATGALPGIFRRVGHAVKIAGLFDDSPLRETHCHKDKSMFVHLVALGLGALLAIVATGQAPAPNEGELVESGVFRLHLYKRPTGQETYEIRRDGDGLVLKAGYENNDRGVKEPLKATLRLRGDKGLAHFEVKGATSRFTQIDHAIDVESRVATVREGKKTSERPEPNRYFCAGGFAPVSVQMMLIRDWERKPVVGPLETLPSGSVTIDKRGRDVIEVAGKRVELDRYSVGGVVWGRETLWMDLDRKLVAAVTLDAEYNRFEAIREGFEPALPFFVARAAEDGMALLAELADRFSPKRAGPLAIVGATLIDGTGAGAVDDAVVVIDGDRIAAAGPSARVTIPAEAKIIQAQGMTLLPGLWEMHAHFTQVEWGPVYLAAGVTTARDCANEFEFITAARDAIAAGRGLGPRLLAAGIIDGDGPRSIGVEIATTPEQAVALAKRYADAGFSQIKLYSSLSPELVKTITQEAHHRGLTVTGHLPEGMDLERGIADGMDQINHITSIAHALRTPDPANANKKQPASDFAATARAIDLTSDRAKEIILLLKEHNTVIDPTVALYELMFHAPGHASEPGLTKVAPELAGTLNSMGIPSFMEKSADTLFRKYLEVIGALHKAGVPIVAGTDQAVPGHSLHRELELYVEAGLTPMEAIQAATIVPARAMKLDRQVGTIEAGKQADLILVAGRPDRKISEIRQVKTVIAAGRVFDCAELWKSVGFRP